MKNLKKDMNTAIMLITHDLGVVAEMAQRIIVMYAGKIVEEGDVRSIFHNPLHPYTEGLLKSIPSIDREKERLHVIEGMVPNPRFMPTGCRFHPRCPYAMDKCRETEPPVTYLGVNRRVSCWLRSVHEEVTA
jgi:oligopeptide/dipeptide ABC transporter ATP-binding protein